MKKKSRQQRRGNPSSTRQFVQSLQYKLLKKYPNYRFAVVQGMFMQRRTISVYMTEYPVELTNKTLIESYIDNASYDQVFLFTHSKMYSKSYYLKKDLIGSVREAYIADLMKKAARFTSVDEEDTWINPPVLAVLLAIKQRLADFTGHCAFPLCYFVWIGSPKGCPARLVVRKDGVLVSA